MALSLPPGLCKSRTEKPFALSPTQFLGTQISGSSPFRSLNRGHGFHKLRWRPLPSELKVYETRKRRNGIHTYVKAALAEMPSKEVTLPQGEMWAVHKFGGTCVGTAERLWNVAGIIVEDQSERKVVVVSAMSKVTDMLYDLVLKAQSRDTSYTAALDQVHEKHKETAYNLLEGDDLDKFLSQLQSDVNNLKAMLHAIYIG